MAGWGTGSFENDDAAAWVANLKMLAPGELTKILLHAADDPDYLEAPAASVAVAAAEDSWDHFAASSVLRAFQNPTMSL